MKSLSDVCVIIAAAGKGERANLGYNKVLWRDCGNSIICRTAEKFAFAKKVIVACPLPEMDLFGEELDGLENTIIVAGGNTRTETVRKALPFCDAAITLIHDGARPNISRELIDRVITQTQLSGCAVPCTCADVALKRRCADGYHGVDRREFAFVQTPQGFCTNELKKAYREVSGDYADDSELWEKSGRKISVVEGDTANVKFTHPCQFGTDGGMRVGTGYDVHALIEGRKLILGGVEVPFHKGLDGHSDADVLTHAVMDALLSAAGLRDIGVLFPDTDNSTAGISSMILLEKVTEMLSGWQIVNLSAVIMAEKPRLAEIIPVIRAKLADKLKIPFADVNISATTTEKLGIVGNQCGMAAAATVLIKKTVM